MSTFSQVSQAVSLTSKLASPQIQLQQTLNEGTITHQVLSIQNHQPLCTITQAPDATASVEVFESKGGLTLILKSASQTLYFLLPGSQATVDGITVDFPGPAYTPQQAKKEKQPSKQTISPQTGCTQATILGAGLATRFEPISGDTTGYAKPAVPLVGSDSVINLIAKGLNQHGFSHLFINTFYKPDSLKQGLTAYPADRITYIDEAAPSGTAGGLRQMLSSPEAFPAFDPKQPILVVQGDAVTDADYSSLIRAHIERNAAVTIGCQRVTDEQVHQFGIVTTDQSASDGCSGNIIGFKEKPTLAEAGPDRLANTGFYIFAPEAYPLILSVYAQKQAAQEPVLDFAQDLFPEVLRQIQTQQIRNASGEPMRFWAEQVRGYWSDIGNPRQYVESARDCYLGKTQLPLPDKLEQYFNPETGVLYWPNAHEKALADQATLVGQVTVVIAQRH